MTTILLVDDHPLFRKGLRLLLEGHEDFLIVGEAGDGEEAIDLVINQSPDVVIMDIAMPGFNGIDATRKIRTEMPSVKVIALSMHEGKKFVEDMLQAGAVGYILKKSVPEDLVNGIRTVIAGDYYLSPSITGIVVSGYKDLLKESPEPSEGRKPLHFIGSKLHRPPIPADLVPRLNLNARFDDLIGRPLTLVSGPAGCGKSTVANLWLEAWDGRHTWLTLDKDDNDLKTFMRYVLAAIDKIFPGACTKVQTYIQALNEDIESDLYHYLVNDLDNIEEPFFLVLDDFHNIRNRVVYELMSTILNYPPKNLHMIVLTRRDPPLITSTLRGRGMVNEIGIRDLQFSLVETTSFFKNSLKFSIDENSIKKIHIALEGWPAGLRLISHSLRHPDDVDRLIAGLPGGFASVMDYLFAEVLSFQSQDMLQLMTATAILERFCAPLCEALKGPDFHHGDGGISGDEFIDRLRIANMFIIPLDDHNRWFRFHHLFKQLLQDQLNQQCRPEAIAALHSRAEAWLAENAITMVADLPGRNHEGGQAESATAGITPADPAHRRQRRFTQPQSPIDPLTNRELDILYLLADRLSNKEIAEKLFISITTVKGHLRNIYQKLDVSKRREAVAKANKLKIL